MRVSRSLSQFDAIVCDAVSDNASLTMVRVRVRQSTHVNVDSD